jgi:phosphate uptake regulator
MSRTIEIISVAGRGRVGLTVKGEPRKITFDDKGPVSLALCDHDEAEILLGLPGRDFWKEVITVTDPLEEQKESLLSTPGETEEELAARRAEQDQLEAGQKNEAPVLTKESYAGTTNLNTLKSLVAKTEDRDLLKELVGIEAAKEDGDERKLNILNGRLSKLG